MLYIYNICNNKTKNIICEINYNEKIIPIWKKNRGYILSLNNIKKNREKCIIFVHGGSFVSYEPVSKPYYEFSYLLSVNTELDVFVPDYTLVPHKTYPTQINEIIKLTNHLKEIYKDVILIGDSSGGTLALSCLLKKPKLYFSGILVSPWIDLESSTNSYYTRAFCKSRKTGDPVFRGTPKKNIKKYKENALLYLGSKKYINNQIANPYKSNNSLLKNLPPTLIIVGDNETIRNDSLDFVSKAQLVNKKIYISLYDRMYHDWILDLYKKSKIEIKDNIKQGLIEIYNFINYKKKENNNIIPKVEGKIFL